MKERPWHCRPADENTEFQGVGDLLQGLSYKVTEKEAQQGLASPRLSDDTVSFQPALLPLWQSRASAFPASRSYCCTEATVEKSCWYPSSVPSKLQKAKGGPPGRPARDDHGCSRMRDWHGSPPSLRSLTCSVAPSTPPCPLPTPNPRPPAPPISSAGQVPGNGATQCCQNSEELERILE